MKTFSFFCLKNLSQGNRILLEANLGNARGGFCRKGRKPKKYTIFDLKIHNFCLKNTQFLLLVLCYFFVLSLPNLNSFSKSFPLIHLFSQYSNIIEK